MSIKKRGVSPVIATVLLILLSVVMSLMILFWARGWFNEKITKDGKPMDNICREVKLEIPYERSVSGYKIYVTNKGSVPISGIEVREVGKNTKTYKKSINIPPGLTSKEENIPITDDNFKKFEIYPMITGIVEGKNKKKEFTCNQNKYAISD